MTKAQQWDWCELHHAQVQFGPPDYVIWVAGYAYREAPTFEEAAQAMEVQMRAKLEEKTVNGSVVRQVVEPEQLMLMERRAL